MSPPDKVRRGILVGAAGALLAVALVALPTQAQSQEVTPTPAATGTNPPAKPHNLQATAEHDQVTVTWTASTDPTVTHYAILRRDRAADATGVFAVIEPNAGPGTNYTDSSVSASSSYVYRAKSVSPTGVSQWSGYARADTPPAPPPPPEPPPPPTTTTQPPPPPTTTTTQAPAPEPVTTTPEPELAPVIGFTLVDATNQTVLATFSDDVWLELDDPDNASFGVRVDTGADVTIGSVRLELSGTKTTARTENYAPYSLYGDDGSALHGASLPAGGYTLRATAYASRGLQGNALDTLEVSFTVTASEPATTSSDDPPSEEAADQDEGPLKYLEAGTEDFVPPVLTFQVFTDADSVVPLNWDLTPSGLSGGNKFRLLFVTATGRAPDVQRHRRLQRLRPEPGQRQQRPPRHQTLRLGVPRRRQHRRRRRHRQHLHHLVHLQRGRPYLLAQRQQGRRQLRRLLRRHLGRRDQPPESRRQSQYHCLGLDRQRQRRDRKDLRRLLEGLRPGQCRTRTPQRHRRSA